MCFCEAIGNRRTICACLTKIKVIVFSLLVFGVGCSPKSLSDLKRTAERTSSRAEQQARRMDEFTQLKREVDGIELQTKVLALLRLGSSDTERVALAKIYFRAFEFQKWTGEFPDTPEYKDQLYYKSLEFFLPTIAAMTPETLALNQRWLSDEWRCLGALAVAMDEIDPMQISSAQKTGVDATSVLTLIQEALVYPAAIQGDLNRTAELPELRNLVRASRRESIYLLQVRYNYLLAIAAQRLSGRGFSFREQLDTLLTVPQPAAVSEELLNEVEKLVDKARATKEFLHSLGVEAAINPNIRHRYRSATANFRHLHLD